MNETMRALRAHQRGGPEQLQLDTIALPTLGPGEVLVEVYATAITFAELTWDETWTHLPAIPGHEFSGVVAALSDDAAGVSVGDEVYGLIRFELEGAAAEYVAVPTADLARKPARLTHAQTAALPLAALTAWQALFDVAAVSEDDRVLVQGGAGGVGIFAVQLAKSVGATVTTTVRGDGVALATSLGADEIIDTDTDDFTERGRRFDVVIDTIGGDALQNSFEVIVEGGRLVTLQGPPDQARAAAAGVEATFFIVAPDVDELDRLSDLADRGELDVVIASTFSLEQGRAAFESGAGTHRAPGKTVLIVRE
ncbi:NADP-dependent oxidoreductase [Subtercola endophyticus]|uniref:NADP-dependent oxidoreductase n=1 Tax=Subtercola endophyticus TaxID=2895559 RepID=UPI001E36C9D8|nr:NADP-dependent oxidoreductase [Subtercola endophyticus]UFS60562.1 NADP-dependent oxidoreductase [Subtercola endophyticus]